MSNNVCKRFGYTSRIGDIERDRQDFRFGIDAVDKLLCLGQVIS